MSEPVTIGKTERDVPILPHGNSYIAKPKSDFRRKVESLEVGDSFFIAGPVRGTITGTLGAVKRHNAGWQFVTRAVDGGFRIWRIA
jgi:hypothetical protein